MDYAKYIENAVKPVGFRPTGITKNDYLDIIELCVKAYDRKSLQDRLPKDGGMVDDIHAYSRVAGGIAALLSNGRIPEYKDLWFSMMDALCNDFHRQTPPTTLDFALKETMLGFKAMKPFIPVEKQEEWLGLLGRIEYETQFSNTVTHYGGWDHIANWNIYAMAGAWLLETEGYTDTSEFFEKYWNHQFSLFDENGMYMDPHRPILYDLTTRVQAQLITGYGYEGKYAGQLDENLRKGAMTALFYQSAAYELPFGGRSSQYLFNETLLTSNFEYEAARYKSEGNLKLAGMFKRAARLAAVSIKRWLEAPDGARHTKNFFPTSTKFGVEEYGYYDKYMMTMGVFLFIGLPFADDSIPEFPCPAELGGYVLKTTDMFHKIFANCGGYSVELDTAADFFYDATGFGRIHKSGIPTELALSAPSGSMHDVRYKSHGCITTDMALSPGWETPYGIRYLASYTHRENQSFRYMKEYLETGKALEDFEKGFDHKLEHRLTTDEASALRTGFTVEYTCADFDGIDGIAEKYSITPDGIEYEATLINPAVEKITFLLPAFITNGRDSSEISFAENTLRVSAMGAVYKVVTDGKITETPYILGNRNGRYRKFIASKNCSSIKVKFSLERS